MRVAIGANHNGYPLRASVVEWVSQPGHHALDQGVYDDRPVDYPEVAATVARMISRGEAERGILLGWTGIGMSIVANKFPGVRAALCQSELEAEIARRHNDANVLCLSVGLLSREVVRQIVDTWMKTPFEGGRHARRLEKIAGLERELAETLAPAE